MPTIVLLLKTTRHRIPLSSTPKNELPIVNRSFKDTLITPKFDIGEEVYLKEALKEGIVIKGEIIGIHTSTVFNPKTKSLDTSIEYSLDFKINPTQFFKKTYFDKEIIDEQKYYIVLATGGNINWENL